MPVIEIATVRLAQGMSHDEFVEQNRELEAGYITQQPGFLSRELASGEGGEYIVVVHWRTAEDAEASMQRFASDPAASRFMAVIDRTAMTMKRYDVVVLG